MSSTMGTFVERLAAVDLAAFVGQPTGVMSFVPGLLLAVAPTWYLFAGQRAPFFYHSISNLNKVTLALVALVAELQLKSTRSELYNNGPDSTLIVVFSFITFWALSLTTVTKSKFVAALCLDLLVIADCIKACFSMYRAGITLHDSFLTIFSVFRVAAFLIEGACWTLKSLGPSLPPQLNAAGIGLYSIWVSPFKIATPEVPEIFGDEVSSARLWRRFNTVWFRQRHARRPSRFMLAWTLAIMFKWELGLLGIVRFTVGFATISQSHAVYHALTAIQDENVDFSQRCSTLAFVTFAYIGAAVFKQAFSRLMNRYVAFIRATLDGQVLYKVLRLTAQDSEPNTVTSLISSDIEGIVSGVPGLLEIVASAIELGAGISSIWSYLDGAALAAFLPSILTIIPSSKLFKRINNSQDGLAAAVDARVSQSTDILSNIPGLKMTGLESTVGTYLNRLYKRETGALKSFRRSQVLSMLLVFIVEKFTPILVLASAMKWTTGRDNLKANTLFATLIQLQLVVVRLQAVLFAYQRVGMIMGCHDRVQAFLSAEEYSQNYTHERPIKISFHHNIINDAAMFPSPEQLQQVKNSRNNDQLQLHNVSITLPGAATPICRDFSLSIPRGAFTVVVGLTASGKSQLLKVLLGEVRRNHGDLFIERATALAYCDQNVWLRPISIKDNILGGQPLDQGRYNDTISRCRLLEEFNGLPDGDKTLVHKRAANLTDSQQHKVALARALYSTASVLVLDDPFSSMDVTTSRQVYDALLGEGGSLRNGDRTVILATRRRRYLANANLAVFLDGEGHIITRESGETFSMEPKLLKMIENLDSLDEPSSLSRAHSSSPSLGNTVVRQQHVAQDDGAVQEQTLFSGIMKHTSKRLLLYFLLRVGFTGIADRVPDILAGLWLQSQSLENRSLVGLLILNSICVWLFGTSFDYYFQHLFPDFAENLHDDFVNTATRATLPHLFTSEYSDEIQGLPQDIASASRGFAMAVYQNIFFLVGVLTDLVILASVPGCAAPIVLCVLALLYSVQEFYLPICHRVQKLDEKAKSSLLTHVLSTSQGIEHVRAFRWLPDMMNSGLELSDSARIPFYCGMDAKRWLDFVLESFAAITAILIAVIGIYTRTVTAYQVGLTFYIMTTFSEKLTILVKQFTQLQIEKEGMRRILRFGERTPSEPAEPLQQAVARKIQNSEIMLQDVTSRNGQDVVNKLAIDHVTLTVKSEQKATLADVHGSDTSSIILAILNLIPYSGSVTIGGIDVSTMPRSQLRSQVTVLPPIPIVVPGTIEQNLMPWRLLEEQVDDISSQTVEQVLEDVQLLGYIRQAGGLQMLRKSLKLSDGQQTQFSVARLILHHLRHKNNIVVMDEPTSRLDVEMRQKLHEALRKYLARSTVLVAGHNPWLQNPESSGSQPKHGCIAH